MKKKLLFLISVFLLGIFLWTPVFASTFGFDEVGTTNYENADERVFGSWFVMPENGKVQSISVYFKVDHALNQYKAGIYEYLADGNAGEQLAISEQLVGEERSYYWKNFPLSVTLTKNKKYFLLIWENAYTWRTFKYTSEANKGLVKVGALDDPLTGESVFAGKFSIYCSYVPTLLSGMPDDIIASTTGYITEVFNDAKMPIFLGAGIPLAFYVIKKLLLLLPR